MIAFLLSTALLNPSSYIMVGDSNTLSARAYSQHNFYTRSGWTMKDAADDTLFAEFIRGNRERVWVIRLGVNDTYYINDFKRSIEVIAQKIHESGGVAYFVKVTPNRHRMKQIDELNAILLEVVSEEYLISDFDVTLDDLWDDVHLNQDGQVKVMTAIERKVWK